MTKFADWFFGPKVSKTPPAPDVEILEMEEVETLDAIPTSADPLWVAQERIARLEKSLDAAITLLGGIVMDDARLEERVTHLERMAGVPEGGT